MSRAALAALLLSTIASCARGSDGTRTPAAPAATSPSPTDDYFVVDVDARQPGVDGFPGAVFRFDARTKTLARFAADPRFVDPEELLVRKDGSLALIDMAADPERRGKNTGAVFVLDGQTGAVTRVLAPKEFVMPVAIAETQDGTVLVVDRAANPQADGRRGCVFALDLATGATRVFSSDPAFRAPAFVVPRADGSAILLDADTKSRFAPAEGVLFRITPGNAASERIADLADTVSPLTLLPEPEGTWLVFDVNADPVHRGGPAGGIFRVDVAKGSTSLVSADIRLRDPVRGCFARDGSVLFVDANADVEKTGPDAANRGQNATGPGALFRLDRASGKVDFVATFPEFVNPVDVRPAPEAGR